MRRGRIAQEFRGLRIHLEQLVGRREVQCRRVVMPGFWKITIERFAHGIKLIGHYDTATRQQIERVTLGAQLAHCGARGRDDAAQLFQRALEQRRRNVKTVVTHLDQEMGRVRGNEIVHLRSRRPKPKSAVRILTTLERSNCAREALPGLVRAEPQFRPCAEDDRGECLAYDLFAASVRIFCEVSNHPDAKAKRNCRRRNLDLAVFGIHQTGHRQVGLDALEQTLFHIAGRDCRYEWRRRAYAHVERVTGPLAATRCSNRHGGDAWRGVRLYSEANDRISSRSDRDLLRTIANDMQFFGSGQRNRDWRSGAGGRRKIVRDQRGHLEFIAGSGEVWRLWLDDEIAL